MRPEVAEGGVDHACEPDDIGLCSRCVVFCYKCLVLISDSCDMEVDVHASETVDEVAHAVWSIGVVDVNLGVAYFFGIVRLKFAQYFLLAPGCSDKPAGFGKISATRSPMPDVAPIITIRFIYKC